MRVKLLPQEKELYVYIESQARVGKERSMRRRRLQRLIVRLIVRLKELQAQRPGYETLLLKLGAAKNEAGRDWSLLNLTLPPRPSKKAQRRERTDFTFQLDRDRLRTARRREGRYLLRSNLADTDPEKLWTLYLQLTQVEQPFKDLKGDLGVRPIYHQKDNRIEAHIMVSFLAYCIHVTLREKLRRHAPGLTPRQALDHLGKNPDDRRASAHHTRPRTPAAPPHRTKPGATTPAHPTEAAPPGSAPAQDHRNIKEPRRCGADLDPLPIANP